MLKVAGYRFNELLWENDEVIFFRGKRTGDDLPILARFHKRGPLSQDRIQALKAEYRHTQELNATNVVKAYALESCDRSWALIIEDFGATPLTAFLGGNTPDAGVLLEVAIGMCASTAALHRLGLLHNCLNPENVFIHPHTREVKLSGLHAVVSAEQGSASAQVKLDAQNRPAYLSPESTGRTKHPIDIRSDLYTLGVIFYLMFTQRLPFETDDGLEMLHAHIARTPAPPRQMNPDLDPVVSRIIMKLLAKPAVERYQSAAALQADLEECRRRYQKNGRIDEFSIGARDRAETVGTPDIFCGRTEELQLLAREYDRAQAGEARAIFFSGPAGVGKSFLIAQALAELPPTPGYRIIGKFERNHGYIPYSAFVQGLKGLVLRLLTESPERLAACKRELKKALGANGQLLTNLVPELELIIGELPPAPDMEAEESHNRFHRTFHRFIGVFAQPQHPLLIVLDDWHWADPASLELFKSLLQERANGYLLLVGAFRESKPVRSQPFRSLIKELELHDGIPVRWVDLGPLSVDHVGEMVANALECTMAQAKPLSAGIHAKTHGNPLFVLQLLQRMHQKKCLHFDRSALEWRWDMGAVASMEDATNVVDLMLQQLHDVSPSTMRVLQATACIGNRFDLDKLAMAEGKANRKDLLQGLQDAIASGFIRPEKIQPPQKGSAQPATMPAGELFRFAHDKVHQAVYAMLSAEKRRATHQRIGQKLLETLPEHAWQDWIFTIVNQLNRGQAAKIEDRPDEELARLNQLAGKKAKAAAAFETALEYFTKGIERLPTNSWRKHYALTLALHTEAAEAAFLCTRFDAMQRFTAPVLQRARHLMDKVPLYEIKMQACNAQNKALEGVEIGLDVLSQLGYPLPRNPTRLDLIISMLKTNLALAGKSIEEIEKRPEIDDPQRLAALRLFGRVGTASYFARPQLMPLTVFKAVALLTRYGNSAQSAFLYSSYGVILCGVLGKFDRGYRFGQLALRLLRRYNAAPFEARVVTLVESFISHWREPLRETLAPLERAYRIGLEVGDLEWAATAAHNYCLNAYFCGRDLIKLDKEFQRYNRGIDRIRQAIFYIWNDIYHQAVCNLLGRTDDPCQIHAKKYMGADKDATPDRSKLTNTIFLLHLHKLILGVLFQRHEQALTDGRAARQHLEGLQHRILTILFFFYESLALLAVLPNVSRKEGKRIGKRIRENRKLLQKWARQAPMNYRHKFFLVEAERLRTRGKFTEAQKYYRRAITTANHYGHLHEAALANELTGRFHLARDNRETAGPYFLDAHHLYGRWGAAAKVFDLENHYPAFFSREAPTRAVGDGYHLLGNPDLGTVVKASQAISGEIVLEKLLGKLIGITMENAGADRAAILLQRDGRLCLEAEKNLTVDGMVRHRSLPLEKITHLPKAIIHYVMRKGEAVMLDDALTEPLFNDDPYIRQQNPRSIFCIAVIQQERLTAILYLENSLSTGVFTQNRRQILELLSAQAAISLQNAILYDDIGSAKQRIQLLTRRLIETQENERLRISRELHDNVAQIISSAKTMGETLFDEQDVVDPSLREKTHALIRRLRASIRAVRELSYDLRPPVLDKLGLAKSIYRQCQDFSRENPVEVDFMSLGLDNVSLGPTIEINLYRIVQEALNNVKKHAGASQVVLRLLASYPNVILRMEDNGCGFDADQVQDAAGIEKRMGLKGMQERVLLLQGEMKIQSQPNHGTKIIVEIPCKERLDEKTHSDRR